YAALVTARHGGKAAIPVLIKLQDNQRLSRPDVLVLANWYLIDLSGLAAPSIDTITKGIE
ncbi:MAG: hypothetical protein KGY81_06570, partial [Phycisphaerae bacterium]|nr:hypothetical protein [Phycisphaerae bacterium]